MTSTPAPKHIGPQDVCAGRPTLRAQLLAQFVEEREYTSAELYAATDRLGHTRRAAQRALGALGEEGVLERVGYGAWRRV